MGGKLWTSDFVRICVANLLLFASLYALFPVLPWELSGRLGIPLEQTGILFLFLSLGMVLVGPFHAYLVDVYKRKYIFLLSFILMIVVTLGYAFVKDIVQLALLGTVQGVAFGMATTAGITVAIDITNSAMRSAGNFNIAWVSRLGMFIGIASSVWLYPVYGIRYLLYLSVAMGIVGILLGMGVYVPFRAPIVTKRLSLDRFLLFRGWVPAINVILIGFIPGLFIPYSNSFVSTFGVGDSTSSIVFFCVVGGCFILSRMIGHLPFLRKESFLLVVIGIVLLNIAIYSLSLDIPVLLSALFLGLGLGLVIPEFLMIFVNLSQHCQRGTANTTHLLFCEVGIALGVAAVYYMDANALLTTGRIAAALAVLFFILVTYPYYKAKRLRS